MSFFKKPMSNIRGIGGVKVNTLLSNDSLTPGEQFEGIIHIYGGEIEKKIFHIYIDVKNRYVEKINDGSFEDDIIIQRFSIDINTVVEPNEIITMPFKFTLDKNCPIYDTNSILYVASTLGV